MPDYHDEFSARGIVMQNNKDDLNIICVEIYESEPIRNCELIGDDAEIAYLRALLLAEEH